MKKIVFFFLFFTIISPLFSQCTLQNEWRVDYIYNWPFVVESALTPQIDVKNRPYLYVASNEVGVRIYKLTGSNPILVHTIDPSVLIYPAMSVSQYDDILYVCVGSSFNSSTSDPVGVVSFSIADPENPVYLDSWTDTQPGSGSGILKVEGNLAYVGGMTNGLFILNVADPSNMFQVGSFVPDVNYPFPNPPANQLPKYNARGMEVKNGIVYLCYDAGGFRIINCTIPSAPIETGRYANPITYPPTASTNKPRAYNNIIINDTLAYIAVDYCGVEILNIKDTSDIKLVSNYNPHNCPTGQWASSTIHASEIRYVPDCNKLFVATGLSKMIVLDVTDPFNIDSCGGYGVTNDTSATWGMDMRNDTIILTYVVGFGLPFYAQHPGVEMLTWTDNCLVSIQEEEKNKLKIYPNPTNSIVNFSSEKYLNNAFLELRDIFGRVIYHHTNFSGYDFKLDVSSYSEGLYFVTITSKDFNQTNQFMITK